MIWKRKKIQKKSKYKKCKKTKKTYNIQKDRKSLVLRIKQKNPSFTCPGEKVFH
jgi:hypothetical protein